MSLKKPIWKKITLDNKSFCIGSICAVLILAVCWLNTSSDSSDSDEEDLPSASTNPSSVPKDQYGIEMRVLQNFKLRRSGCSRPKHSTGSIISAG